MKRFFLRVKKELFLIRRLLHEGYGPKFWWPYAKNRFFGIYLFKRLPRYEYVADPDFELHTICCRQDLWMLAWMLRSFFEMSKLRPAIVIHEDGTMDPATAELIKSKFANVTIIFRKEAIKQISDMPGIPDIIKKAKAEGHFFMDKLIDIHIFSKAKKVLATDTDILYYKTPTEIIDFVEGRSDRDALVQHQGKDEQIFKIMADDFYSTKYQLVEKKIAMMNGGYILINKDAFNLDRLAECLTHVERPFNDYFSEMGAWACLLAQVNFGFLPPERYAIKGRLNDQMVLKHYTSPRRYEMFAYGIDESRKAVDREEKKIG